MTDAKKTLLTLLVERDDILSEIAENQGVVNSFTEDLLIGNEIEIQTKIEGYRDVITEFESRGLHYDGLAEAFQKRARAFYGAAKRLKDNAKQLMLYSGIEAISGLSCSFRVKRTKGSVVCDEAADYEALFGVGSPYIDAKVIYSPNKEAIRTAILGGENITFAKIEDAYSLSIQNVPDSNPKTLKGKK